MVLLHLKGDQSEFSLKFVELKNLIKYVYSDSVNKHNHIYIIIWFQKNWSLLLVLTNLNIHFTCWPHSSVWLDPLNNA